MDREYLDRLLEEVNRLRKETAYRKMDTAEYTVTYMPTKGLSFRGYKQGYEERMVLADKGIKESEKIRSNCRNFLRIYKDPSGKKVQIECVVNGRPDCLHQSLWRGSTCYLFPYSADGGYYPTHTYVTRYENGKVAEEYMVSGNQIVYERYDNETDLKADYEMINYVRGGSYPILEERKGIFYFDPLRYERIMSTTWLEQRKAQGET